MESNPIYVPDLRRRSTAEEGRGSERRILQGDQQPVFLPNQVLATVMRDESSEHRVLGRNVREYCANASANH
jgi:hypothetical protein